MAAPHPLPSAFNARQAATGDRAVDLLRKARDLRASDLHLDPVAAGLALRLRVDGHFVDQGRLGQEAGKRLMGRLKVLAGLMVYRSDIPQEGRLLLFDGSEARLAVIPTLAGEKATVRFFDAGARLERIADLAMPSVAAAWLRARLGDTCGLVLVVGPSGSGKTTTLYAAVAELVASRGDFCHVTSIEDPVERRIVGCTQVQVDPVRQLDFAAGLKFLLRQDPEVVMVGEIRDAETARIAVRAAMTGHLVLSSLHCSSAVEARPRLLEMGVEPYAVEIGFLGCIAQRLLRRLCDDCQGAGCERCMNTGYRGRAAAAEVVDARAMTPAPTLREAAISLVDQGITSHEEVIRVFGGGS